MTWTGQADELLSAITETGMTTAGTVAAAWRAGVDPSATDGLAGAALWLHAEPKDLLSGGLAPLPSDREMISGATDAVTDAGNHLAAARALSGDAERALDAAITAAGAASARARSAKTDAETRAAACDEHRALDVIADCETALEMLAVMTTRLGRAIDCLERVPDDLLTTYELAYQHRRMGRTLPFDGLFLTGAKA